VNGTGAIVLAAALLATAVLAWWARTRNGAIRPDATGSEAAGPVPMNPVFERLGVRAGAADLTVVQFSTAFCAPCRTTRARLQQLQVTRPELAYVHVDAESHLDEVRELDVRRTPTLFYLRRDGSVLARSSGAPQPEELTALVDAHVGAEQR
jgi:glutaredoxin